MSRRLHRGAPRPAAPAERDAEGFILLESIVAVALIGVLLAALAPFFTNSISLMSKERATQVAAQLATTQVETLQGLPATDLVLGRDASSVSAQFAAAPSAVQPWLATSAMSQAVDSGAAAGAGATATVPTTAPTRTVNNATYRVATYLGNCGIAVGGADTDCSTTGASTDVPYVRAVVAVTWSGGSYVTATLFSATGDPTFNLKQTPPPAPIVKDPGNQTSTVGQAITPLQLDTESGTGVPVETWAVTAGSLPAGLALGTSGLISGIPTTATSARSVTVTVTDGFLRTASKTFTWTVVPAPTVTAPANQKSSLGATVTLPLTTTCPATPCTYLLQNGPSGLSVTSAGVITGTVGGTAQVYSAVTVKVTDNNGATVTSSAFTWTVVAAPTIGTPGTLSTTVGAAVNVPLAYTCPYAACTLTLTNAVPGVGLATTSGVTTNNTTTSLSVTATSGTVYLGGTVQASAVTSGTSTAYAPTVTVTDGSSNAVPSTPGSWTIYKAPTIAAPGTLSATEGQVRSIPLAYTCPYVACAVTLTGTVPGLGLTASSVATGNQTTTSLTVIGSSGTVYVGGTIQGTAVTTGTSALYTPVVRITDAGGFAVQPAAGAWTIYSAPTLSTLAARGVTITGTEAVPLTYTCPATPCSLTLSTPVPGTGLATAASSSTNNTTTLTLNSSSGTVYLTGLVGSTAVPSGTSQAWAPTLTLTDANGGSGSTSATWTAYIAPTITNPGTQAVEPSQALSQQIAASCPNGGCTYAAAYQASGTTTWTALTISSSGLLTWTVPSTTTTYTIRITVTDADGVSAQITYTLSVRTFTLTIATQRTTRGLTSTLNLATLINPTAAGYTYAITSTPPTWLTINTTTGVLTAAPSVTTTRGNYSVTVSVTSTVSPTSTVSTTFTWTIQ